MAAQGQTAEAGGLDDMLCFALYSASHAFTRFYKPLLDRLGLTYPQFLVIMALGQSDNQTVGQIAACLMLESATVTPLLKRLEAAGLVTRKRDPLDERQVRAGLSKAGYAALAQCREVPACVVAQLGRTPSDLRALKAGIENLRQALDVVPMPA